MHARIYTLVSIVQTPVPTHAHISTYSHTLVRRLTDIFHSRPRRHSSNNLRGKAQGRLCMFVHMSLPVYLCVCEFPPCFVLVWCMIACSRLSPWTTRHLPVFMHASMTWYTWSYSVRSNLVPYQPLDLLPSQIVFIMRGPVYLVMVARTSEPAVHLARQLQFVSQHTPSLISMLVCVFVCTCKSALVCLCECQCVCMCVCALGYLTFLLFWVISMYICMCWSRCFRHC
jgi:hypothetical protein